MNTKQSRTTQSRHKERYRLLPSLRDADALQLEWCPYVMRRSTPEFVSDSLTTDIYGFRNSVRNATRLGIADIAECTHPIGLVTGNSSAFGIGCTSDSATIPSVLNQICPQLTWFNLAQRATNLTQERQALDLFAPSLTRTVVFVSGGNNLIVTLLNEGGQRFLAPFVGEPQFLKLNAQSASHAKPDIRKIGLRYSYMVETMERDFLLLGQRMRAMGWRCLFLLQPFAAWCDRQASAEELELISIWDDHPSYLHALHKPCELNAWRDRFVWDIRSCALAAEIPFIDLNVHTRFLDGHWVFADRVHLTDEGHQRIAQIIADWYLHGTI